MAVRDLVEEYKELKYEEFAKRFKGIHTDETKTLEEKVHEVLAAHVAYGKSEVLESEIEKLSLAVDKTLMDDAEDITNIRWEGRRLNQIQVLEKTQDFIKKAFAAAGLREAAMEDLYSLSQTDYIRADEDIRRMLRPTGVRDIYTGLRLLIKGGRGREAKELMVRALEVRERHKRMRELEEYTLPDDHPEFEEKASSYLRRHFQEQALETPDETKLRAASLRDLVGEYTQRHMSEFEGRYRKEKAKPEYKHREERR